MNAVKTDGQIVRFLCGIGSPPPGHTWTRSMSRGDRAITIRPFWTSADSIPHLFIAAVLRRRRFDGQRCKLCLAMRRRWSGAPTAMRRRWRVAETITHTDYSAGSFLVHQSPRPLHQHPSPPSPGNRPGSPPSPGNGPGSPPSPGNGPGLP